MQSAENVYSLRPTSEPEARLEPFLPPDVDLRGFHYLPVTPDRLMASADWSRAKREPLYAYRFLALFFAAFRQTPSGSLPDNDFALADAVAVDDAVWDTIKADTMRDWTLCSDGRWHHPIVADCVREAWSKHRGNRDRTMRATAAKAEKIAAERDGQRDDDRHEQRDAGKGEERRVEDQRVKEDSKEPRLPTGEHVAFETFWSAYPHKVGKRDAAGAFDATMKRVDGDAARIMSGLAAYVASKPADRPWCNPATFLRQDRFDDKPAAVTQAIPPRNAAFTPTDLARANGDEALAAALKRGEAW